MPVTVITKEAYYNAVDTIQTVKSLLYLLLVLDVGISCLIYQSRYSKKLKLTKKSPKPIT